MGEFGNLEFQGSQRGGVAHDFDQISSKSTTSLNLLKITVKQKKKNCSGVTRGKRNPRMLDLANFCEVRLVDFFSLLIEFGIKERIMY